MVWNHVEKFSNFLKGKVVHDYQDLIRIFNNCFYSEFNVTLIKGEDEPIYLPADEKCSHNSLYFAHGFFSSALHECSHWLVAGHERRKLVDFGYWYVPDGRNQEQQALFQKVEVKPQAMEWILATACKHPFRLSIDNLNGESCDTEEFKTTVYEQVVRYCTHGLPQRAKKFREALALFYGSSLELSLKDFDALS